MRERPTWGNRPDGYTWASSSWADRARVVGIVLVVILIGLAGSLR